MRWLLSAVVLLPTSAFAQQACEDNTVQYGQHRETSVGAISISPNGGAIGQFYERPGPMDLVGLEIYAYGYDASTCNYNASSCSETNNPSAFELSAQVFLADANGMPTGSALVSEDLILPCRCEPENLDNIRERMVFPAIALTGDYIVTVSNTDPSDLLVVRTNSFLNGDGDDEDLGRHFVFPLGSATRQWFPASSIVVGGAGTAADADVYAHPIVSFDIDASFEVEGPRGETCLQADQNVLFSALDPIVESPIYNTDARSGIESSSWQFGDGASDTGASVSHTYATSVDASVRHSLAFVGDHAQSCSDLSIQSINAVVPQFFDCDGDGFTGSVGDVYCGVPVPRGGECSDQRVPGFALQDEGDCNENNAAVFPDAPETCDNVDNDCNDLIDDNVEDRAVTAPFGECSTDLEFCEAGNWLVDPNNVGPMPELCDGLDQDCNDVVDNGVADVLADNQTGACAGNIDTCLNGGFEANEDTYEPTADVCDGVDNDCDALTADGVNDPQLGEPCDGDDADECDGGEFSCDGGALVCSDGPELENCDDPDTDPDTDPDSNPDPDTDVDTDTDGVGPGPGTRCGCSSGPTAMSLFGFGLVLLGFVARRRR